MTTTLHIEHAIGDLDTWTAAFARFADRREAGGVLAKRVCLAMDDPAFIVIELDFEHRAQAGAFLEFLENRVWSTPTNSPALVGKPATRMLRRLDPGQHGRDPDRTADSPES